MPKPIPALPSPDYAAVFQALPSYCFLFSPDLRVLDVNANVLELMDKQRGQLVGRRFEDILLTREPLRREVIAGMQASLGRVLASRQPSYMSLVRSETPRPAREGGGLREIWWSVVHLPVLNAAGELLAVLHKADDVSAYVQQGLARGGPKPCAAESAELALFRNVEQATALNQQLLELNRVREEFFAKAGHELRTPLTLILAPAEQLLSRPAAKLDTPERQLVELIQHNALRLLRMLGSLEASSLPGDPLVPRPEPLDLADFAAAMLENFRPLMEQQGLRPELDCELFHPVVLLDPRLMERMLFNLLSNAVKFTPSGGFVRLRLRQGEGRLQLEVRDSGIGISPADQARLFRKFSRAEGPRAFEGQGLGLSLVREHAEAMGGAVGVQSAAGKGSTFSLDLPAPLCEAKPIPSQRAKPLIAQPWVQAASGEEARPRVLVAEDNLEMAAFIAHNLASFCQVRLAYEGQEALRLAKEWAPEALLADVMMPGLDGLQLTKTLKSDPATAGIPVVLLTALAGREDLLKGWEAGADDYLTKPFHPRELQARLKAVLETAHWRQRSQALARRKDELERFTHVASHDLREPLRKIGVFSSRLLAQPGEKLEPATRRDLELIQQSATRMNSLIESLVQYSTLEGQAGCKEACDLNALARGALDDLALKLKESGGQVEVGALPRLPGEPALLAVLLRNLIDNALKYTAPGQAPRVIVSAEQQGGEWVLSVQDQGIGFKPEEAEELFTLFKRLHPRDLYPGQGLGLPTCKRIVERHGGRIWAESSPGEGACFHVALPAGGEAPKPKEAA